MNDSKNTISRPTDIWVFNGDREQQLSLSLLLTVLNPISSDDNRKDSIHQLEQIIDKHELYLRDTMSSRPLPDVKIEPITNLCTVVGCTSVGVFIDELYGHHADILKWYEDVNGAVAVVHYDDFGAYKMMLEKMYGAEVIDWSRDMSNKQIVPDYEKVLMGEAPFKINIKQKDNLCYICADAKLAQTSGLIHATMAFNEARNRNLFAYSRRVFCVTSEQTQVDTMAVSTSS